MGYFDDLDSKLAREKPIKPIKLEPPQEGDLCSYPDCGGKIRKRTFGEGASSYTLMDCSLCGHPVG